MPRALRRAGLPVSQPLRPHHRLLARRHDRRGRQPRAHAEGAHSRSLETVHAAARACWSDGRGACGQGCNPCLKSPVAACSQELRLSLTFRACTIGLMSGRVSLCPCSAGGQGVPVAAARAGRARAPTGRRRSWAAAAGRYDPFCSSGGSTARLCGDNNVGSYMVPPWVPFCC